jgi:hypothetical protein
MTPLRWSALSGLPFLICLSMCPSSLRGQDKEELAADMKALKDAGVGTDESSLLEFITKHTTSESQRRLIGELIKQLGDDDFMVREKATRELKGLGSAARGALQRAQNDKDAEVASRAKRCLEAIGNKGHSELLACAARVLCTRKSAKATEVLLEFLPEAAVAGVEEDMIQAVRVVGVSDGKAHPALVRALTDKLPLRRAVAGEALAGLPEYVEALRKLIQDEEPSVRFRVSLALLCSGEKKVVPTLIDCLPEVTRDQAWQVEDVFCRLGGDKVPRLPAGEDGAARKKYRDECHGWWKEHGERADLTLLEDGPRRKAKAIARASKSLPIHSPEMAFDGDPNTMWNAGDFPGGAGQWIEADLGAVRQLGGLLLLTCQLPDGPTTHEIWVSTKPIGDDRTKAKLVHTFNGRTQNLQFLRLDFPKNLTARYVQIRTTRSPSSVAWLEIEVGVR